LNLNQKPTTEQLVNDAATHLGGMNELGQQQGGNNQQMSTDMTYNHMSLGTSMGMNMEMSEQNNTNLLQVMAAQKRHENYMQQQYVNTSYTNSNGNVNNKATEGSNNKGVENKFWALQDDSDDEKEQAPAQPMFNFAAPSFSMPSSSFSTPVASGSFGGNGAALGGGLNIHDDDPDL